MDTRKLSKQPEASNYTPAGSGNATLAPSPDRDLTDNQDEAQPSTINAPTTSYDKRPVDWLVYDDEDGTFKEPKPSPPKTPDQAPAFKRQKINEDNGHFVDITISPTLPTAPPSTPVGNRGLVEWAPLEELSEARNESTIITAGGHRGNMNKEDDGDLIMRDKADEDGGRDGKS